MAGIPGIPGIPGKIPGFPSSGKSSHFVGIDNISAAIQKTTFSNNKAKSVGGAMSLNSLLCRSATTCATNADSVNTMTSAYESCRSGDARASSINNDVSQAMDVLEPCTDIQNVHFERNECLLAHNHGLFE